MVFLWDEEPGEGVHISQRKALAKKNQAFAVIVVSLSDAICYVYSSINSMKNKYKKAELDESCRAIKGTYHSMSQINKFFTTYQQTAWMLLENGMYDNESGSVGNDGREEEADDEEEAEFEEEEEAGLEDKEEEEEEEDE